ncbi:hypothetical protein [Amycolatopsis endophytica]|uniref:hypothetical protein n=1 Tax=Amycolatopsis endophytica TaxID=860233 RepID=UPI001FE96637|nr:hypothetical protein [Amycolatopsis endophytica]
MTTEPVKAAVIPQTSTSCGEPVRSRVTVPKIVTRMASPSVAPVCCIVCSTPPAAPASDAGTLPMMITFSGANASPMPSPVRTIGPKKKFA